MLQKRATKEYRTVPLRGRYILHGSASPRSPLLYSSARSHGFPPPFAWLYLPQNGPLFSRTSPDDVFLLTSAVDNEVKQYLALDGRLHMDLDIPKTGMDENFTRSYYTSSGRWDFGALAQVLLRRLFVRCRPWSKSLYTGWSSVGVSVDFCARLRRRCSCKPVECVPIGVGALFWPLPLCNLYGHAV